MLNTEKWLSKGLMEHNIKFKAVLENETYREPFKNIRYKYLLCT